MHTGVKTHTLTHTYALIHLSAGVAHCRGGNGRNDTIVNINIIITHNSKIIIISNIYGWISLFLPLSLCTRLRVRIYAHENGNARKYAEKLNLSRPCTIEIGVNYYSMEIDEVTSTHTHKHTTLRQSVRLTYSTNDNSSI